MTTQQPAENKKKKQTDQFDKGLANRLHEFRIKHIDKNQIEAAKKLGTSQSWLSYAESGQRRIRMDVVETMVRDFDLNSEWLATGNGPMKNKNPEKRTPSSSLSEVANNVMIIRKILEAFEANLTHAFKKIETLEKTNERLINEIEKLKKG